MERPKVNHQISHIILDKLESGEMSPTEAKISIPNSEKISVIEYIHSWEDKKKEPNID